MKVKIYYRSFLAFTGLFSCIFSMSLGAQTLWKDLSTSRQTAESFSQQIASKTAIPVNNPGYNNTIYKNARLLNLDVLQMKQLLSAAQSNQLPAENQSAVAARNFSSLAVPLPDGRVINTSFEVSEVLPEVLAEKFPEIKTFRLKPDENILSGRIDITPNGFHGMLFLRDGEQVFIEPLTNSIDEINSGVYVSFAKKDQSNNGDIHQCSLNQALNDDSASLEMSDLLPPGSNVSKLARGESRNVEQLLQYRIAIAVTGEFTANKGGTKLAALSAIVTTLNRINQVYEQDLGIHLKLVDNNDEILFVDARTDPYDNSDSDALILKNQEVLDRLIGSENYDIGHLFTTSGGGLARISSVCNDSAKAMGVSGIANPVNDVFYLDFVAHEIGHQFGATHTFNSSEGLCSGKPRSKQTAYEPGSGSTIMSYAGICGSDNLQSHTDAMFHIGSIDQIREFTQNGNGKSCGSRYNNENLPPLPEAGTSYIIPANTPFELNGKAVDPDGDRLVYAWEQIDSGNSSGYAQDTGNNALFRAHLPSQTSVRTFPALENILSHSQMKGETLPIRDRELRFRFVSQDGYNPAQSDETIITVKRTGSRFALNLPRAHYTLGRDYKLSWNTANTDQSPVNCSNVDINLSTDGGYNFNYPLAEQVANTGETWIYLPSSLPETNRARFRLSCSNNVFFAISYSNFRLTLDELEEAAEPGPEPELEDRLLNSSENSSSVAVTSGGGYFSVVWLLLVLIRVESIRQKIRISLRNHLR